MPTIHPSALVDASAELGEGVRVDAFAVVGPRVTIGAGSVVGAHSVVYGPTVIGAGCHIGPGAYVGIDPQHLEFLSRPEAERQLSWLVVGDRVLIRETATVHRASRPGIGNATRIGNDCLLMGGSHVAHDCVLADRVVLAHAAMLGGYCQVAERAFLGGGCAMHQFARVGRLAMVGGNQAVGHDVPPFATVLYGGLKAYNAVGCRRAGLSRPSIKAIRAAWHCIHTHRTTNAAVAAIKAEHLDAPEVQEILDFIATTKRGIQPSVHFLSYVWTSEDGAE